MMTRMLVKSCLILATLAPLSGCIEHQKQAVRGQESVDPTSWNEPSSRPGRSGDDEGSTAGTGKGFLRSTRLPGALSSEAAEIEHSLGVGR